MIEKTIGINCSNCGSNNVEIISDGLAICKNCGTKIVVPKNDEVNLTNNEIHIHVDNNGNSENEIQKFEFGTESDEYEVLRQQLISLASILESPPDIFDAEFEPLKHDYAHFAVVTCSIDMTYSAEIGYDKIIETTTYVNGKRNVDREKITEWQPFSGQKKANKEVPVRIDELKDYEKLNEKSFNYEFWEILDEVKGGKFKKYNSESSKFPCPKMANDEQINEGLDFAEKIVAEECKLSLPGHHDRNFMSSSIKKVVALKAVVANSYSLPFIYNGQKFCRHTFGTDFKTFGCLPSETAKIENTIDKKTRFLYIVSLVSVILSLIILPLFAIKAITSLCLAVCIPTFIVSTGLSVAYYVIRKQLRKKITINNQIAKKNALIKKLSEKNLQPLNNEEIEKIVEVKEK